MRLTRIASATAALVLASCIAANSQESLTRSFARGDSRASVGITQGGEDTELEGPQAIYSGDDGEIYLLDQINNRILKFDPRAPGDPPQAFELPDGMSPTDLVVSNGEIHVWDGRALTLQATGSADAPTRGLTLTRSSEQVDEFTSNAFAQMGSSDLTDDLSTALDTARALTPTMRSRQAVASHGRGAVIASLAPLGGESGVRIDIAPRGGGAQVGRLELRVRSRLGAAELLDIDKRGQFYVFAENVPENAGDKASAFVARFAPDSSLEGVYELPLASDGGLARRFVTVSPEGEVYFLRTRKGSSDILGVGFRRARKGQVLPLEEPAPSFSNFSQIKAANALVRPLTRRQVIENGAAFANVRWRVTPSAYGLDPDRRCSGFNRVRRPGFMNGKLNQDVVGIPYCWGCSGSLPKIASSIQRGMLAGNVCTRDDPRRDVIGVDCSAFVSAAWGLSTHFTTIAIPAIAREVPNVWDLLPGDAFNKPGSHVMLFVRFTPDRKAEVLESSTGGCNGKVCRNIYPVGSLLARGYHPVRYGALLNAGSVDDPAVKRP